MSQAIKNRVFVEAFLDGKTVEWKPESEAEYIGNTVKKIGEFDLEGYEFRIKPATVFIEGVELPLGTENLMRHYGVGALAALIEAQERHVDRLQQRHIPPAMAWMKQREG